MPHDTHDTFLLAAFIAVNSIACDVIHSNTGNSRRLSLDLVVRQGVHHLQTFFAGLSRYTSSDAEHSVRDAYSGLHYLTIPIARRGGDSPLYIIAT